MATECAIKGALKPALRPAGRRQGGPRLEMPESQGAQCLRQEAVDFVFLDALHALGATDQVAMLTSRYRLVGLSALPERQPDVPPEQPGGTSGAVSAGLSQDAAQYGRYGREPDGSAAVPWAWQDLM